MRTPIERPAALGRNARLPAVVFLKFDARSANVYIDRLFIATGPTRLNEPGSARLRSSRQLVSTALAGLSAISTTSVAALPHGTARTVAALVGGLCAWLAPALALNDGNREGASVRAGCVITSRGSMPGSQNHGVVVIATHRTLWRPLRS